MLQDHRPAHLAMPLQLTIEPLSFPQINAFVTQDGMTMDLFYFVPDAIKHVKPVRLELYLHVHFAILLLNLEL